MCSGVLCPSQAVGLCLPPKVLLRIGIVLSANSPCIPDVISLASGTVALRSLVHPLWLCTAAVDLTACPGLQCEVNVLLNDSIGTFAGGRYLDPDIMIGIILGTGTNMAYLERKAIIHNAPHKLPPGYSDEMLINSEWGCYDSHLLPVRFPCVLCREA